MSDLFDPSTINAVGGNAKAPPAELFPNDLMSSVEQPSKAQPGTYGLSDFLNPKNSPGVGLAEGAASAVTGAATGAYGFIGDSVITGWNMAKNIANGMDFSDAFKDASQKGLAFLADAQKNTYQPRTTAGKIALQTISPVPGASEWLQHKATQITGSPEAAQQILAAVQNVPTIIGAASLLGKSLGGASSTVGSRAEWEGTPGITPEADVSARQSVGSAQGPTIAPEAEPIKFDKGDVPRTEGFSPEEIQDRATVLKNVGFDQMHGAFLEGNGATMGGLVQASKTDTLAGQAAKNLLETNHNVLDNYTGEIAAKAGGSIDNTQDALESRGQDITAPTDAMRNAFDQQINGLYDVAKERGTLIPLKDTTDVEALLNDREFANDALASNKVHLLTSMQNKLGFLKDNNPEGLTVANAEDYRKWLNTQWQNDPRMIGRVKDALDTTVAKAAGEDVYQPARQAYIAKQALLGNSDALDKIFDFDPSSPMNRSVPLEKISKQVTGLSQANFEQLMRTYDAIGQTAPELQPLVDRAVAAIKSHYLSNISDLGNANKLVWSADKVTNYLNKNNANMAQLFKPEEMQEIQNLQRAGHILQADASYPGSEAQKINLLKQGIGPELVRDIGTSVGAGIGSIVAGPGGGTIGALGGKYLAGRKAQSMANKAALGKVTSRVMKLSDIVKGKQP